MPRRQQLFVLLTLLLVAAALVLALRPGPSRPGDRRIVLRSVLKTRDQIVDDDGKGTLSGWFRITAVIENREPREVIVDGSALKVGFGSGNLVSDFNPEDPAWH